MNASTSAALGNIRGLRCVSGFFVAPADATARAHAVAEGGDLLQQSVTMRHCDRAAGRGQSVTTTRCRAAGLALAMARCTFVRVLRYLKECYNIARWEAKCAYCRQLLQYCTAGSEVCLLSVREQREHSLVKHLSRRFVRFAVGGQRRQLARPTRLVDLRGPDETGLGL